MRPFSLLALRVSLGGLMVYWGVDKLINVKHGLSVAEKFYGGMPMTSTAMQLFGIAQIVLGALVMLGLARKYAYPALLLITGVTLLAVWKSIVDPFRLLSEGGTLIFYPSLIVVAGGFVLLAYREDDALTADARLAVRAR